MNCKMSSVLVYRKCSIRHCLIPLYQNWPPAREIILDAFVLRGVCNSVRAQRGNSLPFVFCLIISIIKLIDSWDWFVFNAQNLMDSAKFNDSISHEWFPRTSSYSNNELSSLTDSLELLISYSEAAVFSEFGAEFMSRIPSTWIFASLTEEQGCWKQI